MAAVIKIENDSEAYGLLENMGIRSINGFHSPIFNVVYEPLIYDLQFNAGSEATGGGKGRGGGRGGNGMCIDPALSQ